MTGWSNIHTVIRRPRKIKAKAANEVKVKLEPASPKPEKPKRKLEVFLCSEDELENDNVSVDSQVVGGPKTTRGGRGKQLKASGSKIQTDANAAPVRKSNRLNAGSENMSKKARTTNAPQTEALFRRLAGELAVIGRTCEELADSFAA